MSMVNTASPEVLRKKLAYAGDSSDCGAEQIGLRHALSNAVSRSVGLKLGDYVNVKDFGALGDGVANDTAAMNYAHATGRLVYYPAGKYRFTKLNDIVKGGIIGDGRLTHLVCTSINGDDAIRFVGRGDTGGLANECGALFKDFFIYCETIGQKSGGYGVIVDASGGYPNEYSVVENVQVRNFPSSLGFKNCTFFTVKDCYFAFWKNDGIYSDNNHIDFEDNGDNAIINNWFYTNGDSPATNAINYRGGGLRAVNNKLNGGYWCDYGFRVSPLRSTSVILINGNSVENFKNSSLIGVVEGDSAAVGFGKIIICDNQFNGVSSSSAVIEIAPSSFDWVGLTITGNLIEFNNANPAVYLARVSQFDISGNTFTTLGSATLAIRVAESCSFGNIGVNGYGKYLHAVENNSATTAVVPYIEGGSVSVTTNVAYGSFYKGHDVVLFSKLLQGVPRVTLTIRDISNNIIAATATEVTTASMKINVIGEANGGIGSIAWKIEGIY